VPVALQRAQELVRLPDGGWLMLDKNSLRLMSADGMNGHAFPCGQSISIPATYTRRICDVAGSRYSAQPAFIVDTHTGELLAQPALPSPAFALESSCLYRDATTGSRIFDR
jgi:3-phytase